jgi:uncharacterized protein with PIN domain
VPVDLSGVTAIAAGRDHSLALVGPTLPASTEQCTRDAWRTFGVFKNEGDCVSYVATRGKNTP